MVCHRDELTKQHILENTMTYVTEQISEEDKKRIDFDKLTEHMGWRPRPSTWTVDRESGNFLLNVFWGSEDDRNGKKYLFFWNGQRVGIGAEWHEARNLDGLIYFWRARDRPILPVELEARRNEIYTDLKKAVSSAVQGNSYLYNRIEFTMI